MLSDDRVRSIDDYLSAADVFPGVGLKGGVCYFLWDRDNAGPCRVTTHFKDWRAVDRDSTAPRDGLDVFIRFNEGVSILKKVVAVETGSTDARAPDEQAVRPLVSSIGRSASTRPSRGKAKQGR